MTLIDKAKLLNTIATEVHYDSEHSLEMYAKMLSLIDDAPTVDAVEVVRCDDCIYRDGNTPGQPNILCWQMHSDDYCSYGTKREVGTYCKNIVSVVRCEDCKKYIPCQKLPIGTSKWCDLFDRATCEMNYCAWGERREDETN